MLHIVRRNDCVNNGRSPCSDFICEAIFQSGAGLERSEWREAVHSLSVWTRSVLQDSLGLPQAVGSWWWSSGAPFCLPPCPWRTTYRHSRWECSHGISPKGHQQALGEAVVPWSPQERVSALPPYRWFLVLHLRQLEIPSTQSPPTNSGWTSAVLKSRTISFVLVVFRMRFFFFFFF